MNQNEITYDDIIQSYEILISNMANIDAQKKYKIMNLFQKFIDEHKEFTTTEELCIVADMEDNKEVKQKLKIRLAAEEYAASMYSLINEIIHQNTQNDGGT